MVPNKKNKYPLTIMTFLVSKGLHLPGSVRGSVSYMGAGFGFYIIPYAPAINSLGDHMTS